MRIALIGYGKMGKEIEQIALQRNHTISFKIDKNNIADIQQIDKSNTDVAIEFTQPDSAVKNLTYCIENQVPVVCGTTGWLAHKTQIEALCEQHQGSLFYASNFSVGVNIFFQLSEELAKLMANYTEYKVHIKEIHHIEKKDAPSGTAISIAEALMRFLKEKKEWKNEPSNETSVLPIISERLPQVPGTHEVFFESEIDTIEIKHTAHSRKGFATGAVLAAEFTQNRVGVWGMKDLLALGTK